MGLVASKHTPGVLPLCGIPAPMALAQMGAAGWVWPAETWQFVDEHIAVLSSTVHF